MLTLSELHFRPQIVRVTYPVDITVAAIRASGIPDFYADFWLERTGN